MSNRKLWAEGKTAEDIDFYSETDSDNVIYNLHEDFLCLQRENAEMKAMVGDSQRLCERAYLVISEDWSKLLDEEGYGPLSLLKDLEKAKDGKEYKELRTFLDLAVKKCGRDHDMQIAERVREACADIADMSAAAFPSHLGETIRNLDLSEVIKDATS